jgi:hypothetical protein
MFVKMKDSKKSDILSSSQFILPIGNNACDESRQFYKINYKVILISCIG